MAAGVVAVVIREALIHHVAKKGLAVVGEAGGEVDVDPVVVDDVDVEGVFIEDADVEGVVIGNVDGEDVAVEHVDV